MGTDVLRIIRTAAIGLIALLAVGWLAVGLGWIQSGRSPELASSGAGPVIAPFDKPGTVANLAKLEGVLKTIRANYPAGT